jgi:hypothetical protein
MDNASGLAYRSAQPLRTGSAALALLAFFALALWAIGVAVAIAALLPVASDPVVVAPLRW